MMGTALHIWIGFDAPGRLVAIHDRQLNVHQDQVGDAAP